MNPCKGCNSYENKRHYCKLYIKETFSLLYHIFRDKFCPCKECLVKPSCRDPKINYYSITIGNSTARCKELKEAVKSYYLYLEEKNIRKTSLKRKRTKK